MITIRSAIQINMRTDSAFSRAFDAAIGDITSVVVASRSRLVARTSTGAKVELRGSFDLSSENALLNSKLTAFTVTKGGKNLFSLTGFGSASANDFDNPAFINRLVRTASKGIAVVGSAFDDVLVGGPGNDLLRANAGNDQVIGGGGNDRLSGNAGADRINGGPGNDTMVGGAGDDRLHGGAGRDVMSGGAGSDTYWVSDVGDLVREAGNNADLVYSTISFRLPVRVEALTLQGRAAIDATGNGWGNVLAGNRGANVLDGRGGDDFINGAAGPDRMYGGTGNDTFVIDHQRDRVIERSGEGNDTVWSVRSFALRGNVENLQLKGSADLNGTGNGADNVLVGNSGANILNGGGGDDWLFGGSGVDSLIGGSGGDHFAFDKLPRGLQPDTIVDFTSGTDQIAFDNLVFTELASGVLSATNFRAFSDASDGDDYVIYDQPSGILYYDPTGSATEDLQALADLGAGTVLNASDILAGPDLLAGLLPHGGEVVVRADTATQSGLLWIADSNGGIQEVINVV